MKLLHGIVGCLVMSSIVTSFALGSESKEQKTGSKLAVVAPASGLSSGAATAKPVVLEPGYSMVLVSAVRSNLQALKQLINKQKEQLAHIPDDGSPCGSYWCINDALKSYESNLKIFESVRIPDEKSGVVEMPFRAELLGYEDYLAKHWKSSARG